jgi:glycosyltransferase involved in cell wall biosynthesis
MSLLAGSMAYNTNQTKGRLVSNKLKIGFVSQDDAADVISWSGIPYHLLKSLRKQDVSIEVFSPLQRPFRYTLAPLKLAAWLAKKDVGLSHFPIALRSYAKQVKQQMKQRPVDVLLSIGTQTFTMLECPEPIVFFADAVFHGMPEYYGGSLARLTRGAIKRGIWQEERALNRCTFGAYASNWAADAARKYTRPEKIRVVPFGASMPVNHDLVILSRWIAERLAHLPTECQLLFIGVDWERKGGAIAVETARLLNEMGVSTKLTVVGCQPVEPLPEYVEVLGFINKQSYEGQKRLEALYIKSTIFIMPSLAEAAGIVFSEASAFGVPSIAFNTGGVEDYVRNEINGLCLSLDSEPEIFASRICEIIHDAERYSALCLNAFHEYSTRLNWDNTATCLVELCHESM